MSLTSVLPALGDEKFVSPDDVASIRRGGPDASVDRS